MWLYYLVNPQLNDPTSNIFIISQDTILVKKNKKLPLFTNVKYYTALKVFRIYQEVPIMLNIPYTFALAKLDN